MPIVTDIKTEEAKIGVWLTAHHLILYIVLAVVLLGGVYLFVSKRADVADAKALAAEQALAVEKDHSTQLANLYAQNQAQRDRDNATFLQGITQIKAQTQVQIVHDKVLPAPDLGHRIETITGFKQGTISLDPSQNLVVPLPLGQDIVVRLDQGEADAKTVVQQAGIIVNQAATIKDQNAIIAEDKNVLTATITADAKVLSAEKANGRKSKFKWFALGFVSGFVTREFIKP